MPGLSKSRLAAFQQCPKRLWLEVHRRDLLTYGNAAQRRFDVGHAVGELARAQYPDGILIEHDDDLEQAIAATAAALAARRPIFEATFDHGHVLVRADLLLPDGTGSADGWHMAEVKSTASAKRHHLPDLTTQVHVARQCGLNITRATIRHIDTSFTLETLGDYRGFLRDSDLLDSVEAKLPEFPLIVLNALATLDGPEPSVAPGAHCADPYDCPFQDHCGYVEPRSRQHERLAARGPFHDADGAAAAIATWTWPRYHLDFESVAPAIPRWVGTRPYQASPFQYSLHVEDEAGGLTHHAFLDLTGDDPTRACAEALIRDIGPTGTVVAYNAGFEKHCLETMADRHPDLAPALDAIIARVQDLLPAVRKHFYDDRLEGSYSLKAVGAQLRGAQRRGRRRSRPTRLARRHRARLPARRHRRHPPAA